MSRQVLSLDELYPIIDEVISSGGEFRLYPRGTSMMPLLREGLDSVLLVSPENVSVNDIALYKRDDGHFVLHRVVKIKGGEYIMCGDNQYILERGITGAHLLARVKCVFREDTRVELDNKDYVKYVKGLRCVRKKRKIRAILGKIKRKIFKSKKQG